MTGYRKSASQYWLAALVVSLALVPQLLLVGTPYTSNVAGAYLLDGLRLYRGDAPVETQHGPLFGLFVSLIFRMFGVSIVGAAILVKTFFVLSILAFFLSCSELFGKWPAFISSLLVIISRPIYTQLSLHIYLDAQVLALEFCFLYAFVKTLKAPGRLGFALSGLFLGLAILTKENALFFLPYPFLAIWLTGKLREKKVIEGLTLLYGTFLVVMLPWVVFLGIRGPGMLAVLGWLTPTFGNLRDWGVFLEGKTLLENLWFYNPVATLWFLFRDRIFPTELLGRLYALSLLLVFGKLLVVRRERDLLFALAVACSLPLAIITGAFGDRLGHMPEFLFLMHATLPVAVVGAKEVLSGGGEFGSEQFTLYHSPISRSVPYVVFGAAVLAVLAVRSRLDRFPEHGFGTSARGLSWFLEVQESVGGYWKVLKNLRPLFSKGDINLIAGRHTIELEEAGKWLTENMEPTAFIITDGVYDDSMRFFTRMGWPVLSRLYPQFSPAAKFLRFDADGKGFVDERMLEKKGQVLFLTNTPFKFRSQYYRYRSLLLVFEDDFREWLETIFRPEAYIVVHKEAKNHVPEIDDVLLNSALFRRVHGRGAVRILRPSTTREQDAASMFALLDSSFDSRIVEDLKWLATNYPDEFILFLDLLRKSGSTGMLARVRQEIVTP